MPHLYNPTRLEEINELPGYYYASGAHKRMFLAIYLNAWIRSTAPLIPSDNETLATMACATPKEWEKARSKVFVCGFREWIDENGVVWWRSDLLDKAWNWAHKKSSKNAANGADGGKVKAANAKTKAAVIAMPLKQEETEIIPTTVSGNPTTEPCKVTAWIIRKLTVRYPKDVKITTVEMAKIIADLTPIVSQKTSAYWGALIALITQCRHKNNFWGCESTIATSPTEKGVLQSFVNCVATILKQEHYGGVVDKWVAGDRESFRQQWGVDLIDDGAGKFKLEAVAA
jgi:hypothetical protein